MISDSLEGPVGPADSACIYQINYGRDERLATEPDFAWTWTKLKLRERGWLNNDVLTVDVLTEPRT